MLPKLWIDENLRVFSVVGKRSSNRRSCAVKHGGGPGNEYAGISSDNEDKKTSHRKPKVS